MGALTERLTYVAATRVLIPVLSRLPLRTALALGRGIGRFCLHVLRLRRRIVMANLRHVFGDSRSPAELEALADACYAEFGMTLVETLRSLSNVDDDTGLVDYEGYEKLEAMQKRGGAVLCTPHYGSFERLGAVTAARGLAVSVVMQPFRSRLLTELAIASRARSGAEVLQRGQVSTYELLERLEQGRALGLLPDQNTRHGVTVNFLGRPARTYRGPAVLHLRSGAPLAVCVIRRDDDDPTRHRVQVREIPPRESSGSRSADVQAVTQDIADVMSDMILQAPGQYMWFHRRWGRTATGEGDRRRRRR